MRSSGGDALEAMATLKAAERVEELEAEIEVVNEQLATARREVVQQRTGKAALEDSCVGVLSDFESFVRAMAGVVEGSLSEDAGSLPQALSSVRSPAPSSPSALAELLGSAIGQTLDDLGRGDLPPCARSSSLRSRRSISCAASRPRPLPRSINRVRMHRISRRRSRQRMPSCAVILRRTRRRRPRRSREAAMARLEAAAGNALDRLKASQQALRKGVAVARSSPLRHARPPAWRTRRRVRQCRVWARGWVGWAIGGAFGRFTRDYCKPGALEGCVEAAQQRAITAEKRAAVAEARALRRLRRRARSCACRTSRGDGHGPFGPRGGVRLLARVAAIASALATSSVARRPSFAPRARSYRELAQRERACGRGAYGD